MKQIPVRNIKAVKEPASGLFSIRKLEDVIQGNKLEHGLHRHNFFFMLLIKSGEGMHEIDFVPHQVSGKSIFMLRPGQVHQLKLNAGASGYLMEFDSAFYHPAGKAGLRLRKAGSKNFCSLETNRFLKLDNLLSNIFEEFTAKQEGYQDVIKAYLNIFYTEFIRQSPDPNRINTAGNLYLQERFEAFNALLEKHITTHKQVSQYTDLMLLSAYQLNEITKAAVGKTASELIDAYILLEAKRYLLATSNQVKEVADLLGYDDVSYFIRFFRRHTGLSPEAFRKNFK